MILPAITSPLCQKAHESVQSVIRYLDRFSRFCTAYDSAEHIDIQTNHATCDHQVICGNMPYRCNLEMVRAEMLNM